MSTYLDNSPTYLPTVQPYEPNFQLYAGTLEFKQTKYDTNKSQLSNLYGSLLNSPMLRDSNIKTRDEFFKTIEYEIKKIADLDLSLQENVQQAGQMFNSLYDDEALVKDMMWTENYADQKKRGNSFRNCFDPEKCGGGFWEEGLMELDYRAEEFRNMSDEEAMAAGNVRFTPYIDVMKKAATLMKDMGWKDMSVDQIRGDGYIATTTNGPELMAGPLMELFSTAFEKDPQIKRMYQTQAYVERKQWVKGNAAQYGSEEAAEQVWVQETQNAIQSMFAPMEENLEFSRDVERGKKAELEERIRTEGTTGDDGLAQAYIQSLENEQRIDTTMTMVDGVLTRTSGSNNARTINQAAEALDGAYGAILFNQDLQRKAVAISKIGQKYELKADPIYAARLAASAKKDEDIQNTTNGFYDFGPTIISPAEASGAIVAKLEPTAESKYLLSEVEDTDDFLANASINNTVIKTIKTDVMNGRNSQSSTDLLNITGSLVSTYADWANRAGSAGDKRDAAKKLKAWNRKTNAEQLAWAKTDGLDYIRKKIDGRAQQELYDNGVNGILVQAENDPNGSYLQNNLIELYPQIQYVKNNEFNQNTWLEIASAYHVKAANKASLDYQDSPLANIFEFAVGKRGSRTGNQTAVTYAASRTQGSQWRIVQPNKAGQNPMSRFTPQIPDFLNPGADEVVSVTGDNKGQTMRRDELEGTPEYAMRQSQEELLFATGNDVQEKTPFVKIPAGGGKFQEVFIADFFDDEGLIEDEYVQHMNTFQWGDSEASKEYEKNFRYAKWAWKMGEKSDAWTKNDDGTWTPDPYKERTTWLGRRARDIWSYKNFMSGNPMSAINAYGVDNTLDYYTKSTNYSFEPTEFYGNDYSDNVSLVESLINRNVSSVSTPQGNAFGDVTGAGGSYASKGIRDVFNPAVGGTMHKSNLGFAAYYQASQEGIGTDAGMSWITFGPNKSNSKQSDHDVKAAEIWLELVTMANQTGSPKGTGKIMLQYDYWATGGGENTQAMTIRPLFDTDATKMIENKIMLATGTTKKDDPKYIKMYNQYISGITLYQPDAVAIKNGGHYLYRTTKVNNLEKIMATTSEIQVPGYDDISTLKIIKRGGQYVIEGDVQRGWDYDNNKPHMAYQQQTWPIDTPITDIMYNTPFLVDNGTGQVNGLSGYLEYVKEQLVNAGEYRSGDRIYDPSFISDEWYNKMTTSSADDRKKWAAAKPKKATKGKGDYVPGSKSASYTRTSF